MTNTIFLPDPESATRWCESRKIDRNTIGMVPTMGALHAGHLSLVSRAVKENDICVVSIFVNPLQFNEKEDYKAYPRDRQMDHRMLENAGCNMVFSGTLDQFFPEAENPEDIRMLDPGPFAVGLEDEHRPGHFAGVRTIVDRLFDTVRPTRAYFGEKDFQQSLVIKDLAKQKGFPQIIVCATERESGGLAMSSRNRLLNDNEKKRAAGIYRALGNARNAWRSGVRTSGSLRESMTNELKLANLDIEYATIRDPQTWGEPDDNQPLGRAQALIAVRLGEVRLIDNLRLDTSRVD